MWSDYSSTWTIMSHYCLLLAWTRCKALHKSATQPVKFCCHVHFGTCHLFDIIQPDIAGAKSSNACCSYLRHCLPLMRSSDPAACHWLNLGEAVLKMPHNICKHADCLSTSIGCSALFHGDAKATLRQEHVSQ